LQLLDFLLDGVAPLGDFVGGVEIAGLHHPLQLLR
jgi:hypothetical protein